MPLLLKMAYPAAASWLFSNYGNNIRNVNTGTTAAKAYLCRREPMRDSMTMGCECEHTIDIQTVDECNRRLGCKTQHPLAALINIEQGRICKDAVKFDFYAILMMEKCPDGSYCGRKYYDFQNATMAFLRPGEVFRLCAERVLPDKGWLLAFHPDLIFCTSLKRDIRNYTFFAYNKNEALHLSNRETATITCCLEHIEEELRHPIDTHTCIILSRVIELTLDYCARFYERQFITREEKNKRVMAALDTMLDDMIGNSQAYGAQPITIEMCAGRLGLSEAYLADLLRFVTGNTFDEYLRGKRIAAARHLLASTTLLPAAVAAKTGFTSLRRFCIEFKAVTGKSPKEYKFTKLGIMNYKL